MTAYKHRLTPLALAVALASAPSYGLTLGNLETNSALGQPFKGRITLSNLEDTSPEEIRAVIASEEQYQQLNVRQAYRHAQFRLAVIKEQGRTYIDVRSPETIDEPILNFVVTVRWPKGHMAKEFLVLLDPPAYQPRKPVPRIQQPKPRAPASTYQQPKPSASGSTYRTQSGDSLWVIARSLKPSQLSIHQAMDALYQLNPGAFINGNRDLLRAGYQLQLPSWTALPKTTQTRAPKPVLPKTEPELAALRPDTEATTVSTPATTPLTAASSSPETQVIRSRIDNVNTSVESLQIELAENQAKLAAMEAQLEQLIALQRQLLTTQAELINSTQANNAAQAITAPAAAPATGSDSATIESVVTGANNAPPKANSTQNEATTTGEQAAITSPPHAEQTAASSEMTAPAVNLNTESSAVSSDLVTSSETASSTNRWPLYIGILLLAAAGLWFAWRRRSPLNPTPQPEEAVEQDLTEVQQEANESQNTSSAPTDTEIKNEDSEPEWLQMAANDGRSGKSDPLLDANIYLVYGRLDDADRLLTNALRDEPERVDLRLLQLKLYQQKNDRKSFEDAANQLEPLADDYERRQIGQLRDKFTG